MIHRCVLRVREKTFPVEVEKIGGTVANMEPPSITPAGKSEAPTPSVEAPTCSREKVDAVAGSIRVPLAGKMAPIERKVGDNVETDETVLALENMKMENTAMAPESCRLREIPLSEADNVTLEDVLLVIE